MPRRLLVIALLALSAAPVSAQSLFSTRGLGAPIEPLDPRARALGSVGTGLPGLNNSLVNPADLAGILRRGVTATIQPYFASEQLGDAEDNLQATRFPVIQLIYPIRNRVVLGLGYGGVLDQNWAVFADGTEVVGGANVPTRDEISSSGGIAQIRFSASYGINQNFAIGGFGGIYTGGVERSLTRTFTDSLLTFRPFSLQTNWDYRGVFAGVGVRADPGTSTRISAVATVSGDLTANARNDDNDNDDDNDLGIDATYSMPIRVALGASRALSSRVVATASAQWTGWSTNTNFAAPGTLQAAPVAAKQTWEFGAGIEIEELRTATRVFPLRAGFRYAQLPFRPSDNPNADVSMPREIAGALGIGLRLAADDFGPLAVADISVERGKRSGWSGASFGELTENFWRFSASISLFGR